METELLQQALQQEVERLDHSQVVQEPKVPQLLDLLRKDLEALELLLRLQGLKRVDLRMDPELNHLLL